MRIWRDVGEAMQEGYDEQLWGDLLRMDGYEHWEYPYPGGVISGWWKP